MAWRIYKKESIMDRSCCPNCKKTINWYDNIPILSFIILGGKCRHCKKPISWQYPLVELTMGVLFALAFYFNFQFIIYNLQSISNFQIINFIKDLFIISVMVFIFIYDLKWMEIPDIIILPACAIVFILNLLLNFSWLNLLIYGIISMSFFLFQFVVSNGKWIGGGDIRLGLFIGTALGRIDLILLTLFLTYFVGSIISIFLLILKKANRKSQMPLGVFIAIASIITLFYGERILDWYLNGII